MKEKMNVAMMRNYLRIRNKIDGFMKEEDGMEVLQTVILIAIAVIVAGALITFLGSGEGDDGIVSKLFTSIKEKLKPLIGE